MKVMLWTVFFALCILHYTYCYIVDNISEYVQVSSCESCQLLMTCRHLSAVIAVFNATFVPFSKHSTYAEDVKEMRLYPRLALNRRCSGVNHCSFVLTEDCPGADRWGPGHLTVKFACIADRRIARYCNENITLPNANVIGISEGLIRNPGYPNYYTGKKACVWRIRAPPMQRIQLTILDLSLISMQLQTPPMYEYRDDTVTGANDDPKGCNDVLEVTEIGNVVFSSCNEQEPYVEVVSLRDTLDITLKVSEDVVARRGVLLYYAALGCSTPKPPVDGYLVYRNDTFAVFTCCVGYVFSDNHRRTRDLRCLGHRWDHTLPLPTCTKIRADRLKNSRGQNITLADMAEESLADVLVPAIIIIMLFVINAIVLFLIYQYKKRKIALYSEEELGTISVGVNN